MVEKPDDANVAASGVTKKVSAKSTMAKPRAKTSRSTTTAKSPRAAKSTDAAKPVLSKGGEISPLERELMIREAAYYRAERRGFVPGFEQADWLAATDEIDALLASGKSL